MNKTAKVEFDPQAVLEDGCLLCYREQNAEAARVRVWHNGATLTVLRKSREVTTHLLLSEENDGEIQVTTAFGTMILKSRKVALTFEEERWIAAYEVWNQDERCGQFRFIWTFKKEQA